jgi:hypothetical protein
VGVDVQSGAVVAAIPTESPGTHWLAMHTDADKVYMSGKHYPHLVVADVAERKLLTKVSHMIDEDPVMFSSMPYEYP